MITTDVIFWTQIGSIVAFVVTLFVLYRVLVEQKDATIQLQKENIAYLKDQLADAKLQSPDVLAASLAKRIELFEEELKRLLQDKTSTDEQIRSKELELTRAHFEAEELDKKVRHAHDLLQSYFCPHCGAPLTQRSYQAESAQRWVHELDADHEFKAFECGYEVMDGSVVGRCSTLTEAAARE